MNNLITRSLAKTAALAGLASLATTVTAKTLAAEASPGLGTLLIRWLLALLG
jgi:hypothetical protein